MTTKTIDQEEAGTRPAVSVAGILDALPDELDRAGEAVGSAVRSVGTSVSSAPDGSLLVGASLAAGVAIGLLVGGAPRLFTAAAVAAALSLGASLAQRHTAQEHAGPTRAAR